MSDAQCLLKLDRVSKNYHMNEGGATLPVLQDVSLEIQAGESVGIIGPSGSGKSTVLNILGTLDQPSAGRVWLAGRDLSQLDERTLAEIRNREVGFIFQAHHLL